ncbi:monooxygenase (plasmid) [Deinococcus aetherius]|uniref:Monooxygenase n=1 Tax=Deinococcus aetherius TaxID=200252 RepID=A0ABM8AIE1_9DEIO|nr:NAD(P)/FAD-dependent oxidoreductase [Deinococcus aetherius]BDP43583.1 monooxygenase [Deinococcus aetherius]
MFNEENRGKRVAVIGAGPGGLSAGLALHNAGYEVRVFERNPVIKPMGGAILLNTSVLMCLRNMGVDITDLGVTARTEMCNKDGRLRVDMPFSPEVEHYSGIPGWNYGLFRAQLYERMLAHIPPELLVPGHELQDLDFVDNEVRLIFTDGTHAAADLIVGADGIRSVVSRKLWGDPELFPLNLTVNLGFTAVQGIDRSVGRMFFSDRVQFGYHPMKRDGVDAFEWWCVEAWPAGKPFEGSRKEHIRDLTRGFADPVPRIVESCAGDDDIYRWEIWNRPRLKKWSKGRATLLGDAVHPASPYAAYGAGLAIEDGYFLAKTLGGRDLTDRIRLDDLLEGYEAQREAYTYGVIKNAQNMGNLFHHAPPLVRRVRDFVFDHSRVPGKVIRDGYLRDTEAHVRKV